MADVARKGGKKNRKHDRNRPWCKVYRAKHQREKNRIVRLKRYLRWHSNDEFALRALARWQADVRVPLAA